VEQSAQAFAISSTARGLLFEILDAGVEKRSERLTFGHVD